MPKKVSVEVTKEECLLVKLLADGKTVVEAAEELKANPRTLERTVYDLRKSTKSINVPNLVAFFFRNGLIK